MVFSGAAFLFYFLPLALALNALAPGRWKNAALFLCSLVFYAWGEPVYVLLLLFSSVADYLCGLLAESQRGRTGAKWALGLSLFVNLSLLGAFKYAGLFVSSFNTLTGLQLPVPQLRLPIGISFYTFQTMSYTIDVYRGRVRAQRDFIAFAAFVSMFPQLVAGPIVRYSDIENSLLDRRATLRDYSDGAWRFTVGLSKKLLLANAAGQAFENIRQTAFSDLGAAAAWLGIVCFFFQIYFDFSGYSDMAVGLGRMLGFTFPENFDHPYASTSVTEFWRRWHMSLSAWFRDYVYIPLGGNRKGLKRQILNLLITWLLTGLWHGAGWNFALWGLYYFAFLALEKLWLGKRLQRAPRAVGWAYTLLVTLVGWTLFAFDSAREGGQYLLRMFAGAPLLSGGFLYRFRSLWPLLPLMALAASPLPARLWGMCAKRMGEKAAGALRLLAMAALLLLSIASVASGGYDPFLYFRF